MNKLGIVFSNESDTMTVLNVYLLNRFCWSFPQFQRIIAQQAD